MNIQRIWYGNIQLITVTRSDFKTSTLKLDDGTVVSGPNTIASFIAGTVENNEDKAVIDQWLSLSNDFKPTILKVPSVQDFDPLLILLLRHLTHI